MFTIFEQRFFNAIELHAAGKKQATSKFMVTVQGQMLVVTAHFLEYPFVASER